MAYYVLRNFISSAIFMYGPATTLSYLTNLDQKIAIAMIGVIGTFYTTIGGLRAVIWTDLFQALVMFTSLFFIIIKGLIDVGGFENLWKINEAGGRLNFFDFNPGKMGFNFGLNLYIIH
jgi:Na+/proline symporter